MVLQAQRARIDSWLGRELFYVGSGRNRLGRMKKVWLLSNWHGGVTVKAVVHQGLGGEVRFPAGPRALLSWFQSGRKELESCNRFEELNK